MHQSETPFSESKAGRTRQPGLCGVPRSHAFWDIRHSLSWPPAFAARCSRRRTRGQQGGKFRVNTAAEHPREEIYFGHRQAVGLAFGAKMRHQKLGGSRTGRKTQRIDPFVRTPLSQNPISDLCLHILHYNRANKQACQARRLHERDTSFKRKRIMKNLLHAAYLTATGRAAPIRCP